MVSVISAIKSFWLSQSEMWSNQAMLKYKIVFIQSIVYVLNKLVILLDICPLKY